jgi:hypothetical protein
MKYSRNLGTGEGIELIINHQPTGLSDYPSLADLQPRAYPNPFNPRVTISFRLKEDQWTKLEIYNAQGRKMATLSSEYLAAGNHEKTWNGWDLAGKKVPAGVYFYHLVVGKEFLTGKLALVK